MQIKGLVKKDPKTNKDSILLIYNNGNKNIEVRISPYFGSNIYKLKFNGKDLIYCDYKLLRKRDWTGCFILWPLPNRVRDKKFEFEGKVYSLENIKRKRGNYPLIHGLVDDQIWQTGEVIQSEHSVKASTFIDILPGNSIYKFFPFTSRLTLTFILDRYGLKIKYQLKNFSSKNMPFGFALHPYFSLLSARKNTVLYIPAKSVMEMDENLLPTGKLIDIEATSYNLNSPIPVSNLSLDHVFTNLDRSKKPYIDYLDKKMRVYLESSKDFTHLVVYTPQRPYICLENQTGSIDMINLHTKGMKENNLQLIKAAHLLVLSPRQEQEEFVRYRVENY